MKQYSTMPFRALLAAGVAFASVPAIAQEEEPRSDDLHTDTSAQIVVTAQFVDRLDVLAGTSTLSGTELDQSIRPQIGDSLTALPGVSATSFSPGASRPVLRGFQGGRVAVLTDGIGSIDASNTSADHAVTIDPLTSYRIEVLRGPAALLFGSQAIGGAVNVFDRRIPREVPDEPVHFDGLANYATAANDRSIAGALDVPLTSRLVAHVDGSYRNSDDVDISGYTLAPNLRAEQLDIAAEETEEGHLDEAAEALELANLRGTIPNSATETWTAGAGLAFIDEWGNIGASVSFYDTDYGVPARPGAEHHHDESDDEDHEEEGHEEEGPVTIGLQQVRADLRAEIFTGGGFFESIKLRLGYADYEHTEFEGDEVGTRFLVSGLEGRLELVQADRDGWRGVIGGQLLVRDFNAIGAEAFVPRNDTEQYGLFTIQEFELGSFGLEIAGRYEHTSVEAPPISADRSFNVFSGAVGLSYEVASDVRIGANLSRAERAPTAEELFSDGPHIATQAYEVGNPTFDTEKSIGLEGYVRGDTGRFSFALTGFVSWFDDFIYDTATGAEEDGLPVFQYFQQDATYLGFEGEFSALLAEVGTFDINADIVADYVRATVDGGGPVPRIPPLRVLTGVEAQSDMFDARIEAEWVAKQDRIAAFETPTDGFTLVNVSAAWRPWGRANGSALFVSVNNLFDVNARRHASFTKDFVPLAGIDFRVGVRARF
jgi:iron complex outermembrane receptor protein